MITEIYLSCLLNRKTMKSIQVILLFIAVLALTSSCKNDKAEKVEEKVAAPTVKTEQKKTKSSNTVAPVEALYRITEVDTPALFSASCKEEKDMVKCSRNLFQEYIKKNLVKPSKGQNIKQREVITFTIMPDGSVADNIRSISKKEVCPGCRDAAIKVLSSMPKWVPAEKDGIAVSMSMTVPVSF